MLGRAVDERYTPSRKRDGPRELLKEKQGIPQREAAHNHFRELILTKLEQGFSAWRIYQDLLGDHSQGNNFSVQ